MYATKADQQPWDGYVREHADASLYHMYGWRDAIHKTYGHATYYLMVHDGEPAPHGAPQDGLSGERILGVLPLVHFKNIIFGNCLVSLPYLDGGGILASNREAAQMLLSEAVRLGRKLGAGTLELRHEQPLPCWAEISASCMDGTEEPLKIATRTSKVRMLLSLPESSGMLMPSFKSTVRNRIKKAINEGFTSRTGGVELLKDFYRVFCVNMRDLGSPVHSVNLARNVLEEFPGQARLIVVYKETEAVATALMLGINKTLRNPWVSSLRKYALLSPNMFLYQRMLEYACDHGYRAFDFGRSSPGEGTYIFKEKWGAVPAPLHWHYISLNAETPQPEGLGKERFELATHYWKKLPVVVTRIIGPSIRKHISL